MVQRLLALDGLGDEVKVLWSSGVSLMPGMGKGKAWDVGGGGVWAVVVVDVLISASSPAAPTPEQTTAYTGAAPFMDFSKVGK